MRTHDNPDMLTVSQAGKLLGITRQRVYVLIGKGMLSAVKGPGGHVFVTRASVNSRLERYDEYRGWLTTPEVAAARGVSEKTVRRWHQAGHLRGKLAADRRLRFNAAEVAALIPPPVGRPPARGRQ